MQISQLLKQHPSLIYADEMMQACKPLQKLGIHYFSHVRIDEHGAISGNCTDPAFFNYYLEYGYQNFDLHLSGHSPLQRYFLWDFVTLYGKTEELYRACIEFGKTHTFTIIEGGEKEKNLYHFATKPGNSYMNNFYIQHLDLLEQFIAYFKEQLFLNNHLNKAYDLRLNISKQEGGYLMKESQALVETDHVNEFLQDIGHVKGPHLDPNLVAKITRREHQCAHYLLEGYTSKEIADKLYLSPRTVEVYLERLRARFGSKNKIQLARHIIEAKLLNPRM